MPLLDLRHRSRRFRVVLQLFVDAYLLLEVDIVEVEFIFVVVVVSILESFLRHSLVRLGLITTVLLNII